MGAPPSKCCTGFKWVCWRRLKRVETALNKTWAQSHILARGRGESFRLVYTSPRFHHDLQRADRFVPLLFLVYVARISGRAKRLWPLVDLLLRFERKLDLDSKENQRL